MRLKENLQDIFKEFCNAESLDSQKFWRLMYYIPKSAIDDPLSSSKSDVLTMDNFWDDIQPRLFIFTPRSDDLTSDLPIRVCMYPGLRVPQSNKSVSNQEIYFDVFVHSNVNDMDLRMSWILDTIHDIMFNQRLTGIFKTYEKTGVPLSSPAGFIGYRLPFVIGSAN